MKNKKLRKRYLISIRYLNHILENSLDLLTNGLVANVDIGTEEFEIFIDFNIENRQGDLEKINIEEMVEQILNRRILDLLKKNPLATDYKVISVKEISKENWLQKKCIIP